MADTKEVFSERLRKALKDKGMQQNALAKAIGFSSQAVNNFCLGKNLPNAEALVLISQALNVSIDDLLGNSGVRANKGEFSHSDALRNLVAIADVLKMDLGKDLNRFSLSFNVYPESMGEIAGDSENYATGGFFDSWIKYRELLKGGHITPEEYESLVDSCIRRIFK